jgi:periplasmic protein TonB
MRQISNNSRDVKILLADRARRAETSLVQLVRARSWGETMKRTPSTRLARAAAAILLGSIAAACTTVQPPAPKTAAVPPAPPPKVAAIKPVPRPAPAPRYRSMQEYEVVLARSIYDSNAGHTVKGRLQPLLRAVVVLHFQIDAQGRVHNVRTWRAPDPEADRLARASLRRTGALPAPPEAWLRDGALEVTETWLFNSDGRFHLRALNPRQG